MTVLSKGTNFESMAFWIDDRLFQILSVFRLFELTRILSCCYIFGHVLLK